MKFITILLMSNACFAFAGTKPTHIKPAVVAAKPSAKVKSVIPGDHTKVCAALAKIKVSSPQVDNLKKINGCK